MLRSAAVKAKIDVLLVQEPYVSVSGKIPGYGLGSRIIKGSEAPWPITVVLNPGVEVFRLARLSDSHCVVAQVVKGDLSLYMVSIYCQESHEIGGYLERLRHICLTL